ncbi:MAG: transcription termination factor Rho [Pseudomonadota bacterium]
MHPVSGYLEIMDKGFGFLRDIETNYAPKQENPYVPFPMIKRYGLREGSLIQGFGVDRQSKNRNLEVNRIETVNGLPLADFALVKLLQDQVSLHPDQRYLFTQGPDDFTGMALDRIVPIGKGQRGLIISPPKSGKTTILRHMANSMIMNHPNTRVFVLLVDERPEEVTDFKRGLVGAHVLYSSADQKIAQHMRMTRLAIHTAIRCAEIGEDAVVFIDSLTRMTRAFNSETESFGRTLTGGLGANTMEIPRKIFGAARNLENGGSLTIVATILVDTGSKMDDIIFQEFKGTGNMDLVLSRPCAEQRVWPALNINRSGTRKEDLLLSPKELQEIIDLRRRLSGYDEVIAMQELLSYLKEKG